MTIEINRASVLTLWAAVVAERLGYGHDAALTLGKAVAGLNAQSKGQRLGIYKPGEKPPAKPGEQVRIDLLGRAVPVEDTEAGLRAVIKGTLITPKSVERYLAGKFRENLPAVTKAMTKLAERYEPEELAERAFALYEQFRPDIPAGVKGWGAAGTLDLDAIARLGPRR